MPVFGSNIRFLLPIISTEKNGEAYQDSLYALMDHTSFDYKLSRAYSYAGRDSTKAIKILDELLNAEEVGTPNYAMITHSYAMLSRYLKREDDAKKYLMMSAIADIQNATRETASLQALALINMRKIIWRMLSNLHSRLLMM